MNQQYVNIYKIYEYWLPVSITRNINGECVYHATAVSFRSCECTVPVVYLYPVHPQSVSKEQHSVQYMIFNSSILTRVRMHMQIYLRSNLIFRANELGYNYNGPILFFNFSETGTQGSRKRKLTVKFYLKGFLMPNCTNSLLYISKFLQV